MADMKNMKNGNVKEWKEAVGYYKEAINQLDPKDDSVNKDEYHY